MSRVEKALLALLPAVFAVGWLAPGAAVEPTGSEVAFSFVDPEIHESSGLVISPGGDVVTVNDSGDSARVFTVDPESGETVGVARWSGEVVDVEALARSADAPHDTVLVGDIGDNTASRDEVAVWQVPYGRGDGDDLPATRWRFAYSDGPHDAETLLVHPVTGRVYVVVKEFIGRVYEAPEQLDPSGVNELTPLPDPDGRVLGISTDGTFFPDGRHVLLRNYGQAAVYTWPELDRLGTFDLPAQQQGEGIAVDESGQVLISSEGEHAEVLRVELPADIRDALARSSGSEAQRGGTASGAGPPEVVGEEAPVAAKERDWWPWTLGGAVVVGAPILLLRARRSA